MNSEYQTPPPLHPDPHIRHFKSETQKLERQAYHHYINTIIEVGDSEDEKPTKQKRFWNYIKSLRKDNTGISSLKDKGRLFNNPKDKANILNRQYVSVHTHEDQDQVPSPSGTPFPDMDAIQVTARRRCSEDALQDESKESNRT